MTVAQVDRIIWMACVNGDVILLLVLLVRKRASCFPVFSLFILQEVFNSVAGFFIQGHISPLIYLRLYWSAGILDECLQLVVLYEIATHIFAPMGKWAADVRKTLLYLACLSVAIAGVLSLLANPATNYPIQTLIVRSNFFSAALTGELFVCMVVLSSTVGLPWKTHAARIAQGLGAFSIACLAIGVAKVVYGFQQGPQRFQQLNHARSLIYLACEVYWIATLWAEAPAPSELPAAMRNQIYTLQKQVENDLIRIRSWRKN